MFNFLSLENLNALSRVALVQTITFLLFCLSITSFSIFSLVDIQPYFVLIPIYYWAVYRPTLIPVIMTFTMGVLLDLLSGVPLGINTIPLLFVQWIVKNQRLFLMGQPFMVVSLGFFLSCCVYALFQWVVFSFAFLQFLPITPLLISIIFSVCLFPLFAMLFVVLHRFLPVASKPYQP